MALVLEETLQTVKDKQWALADVDWDAPEPRRSVPSYGPNSRVSWPTWCG